MFMLRIVMKKNKTWLLVACAVGLSLTIQAQKVMVIDTDFSKDNSQCPDHPLQKIWSNFIAIRAMDCWRNTGTAAPGWKSFIPEGVFDRTNTRVISKSSPSDRCSGLSHGHSHPVNTFMYGQQYRRIVHHQRGGQRQSCPGEPKPWTSGKLTGKWDLAIQKKLSYAQQRTQKMKMPGSVNTGEKRSCHPFYGEGFDHLNGIPD